VAPFFLGSTSREASFCKIVGKICGGEKLVEGGSYYSF
jgi:hypothetical protein